MLLSAGPARIAAAEAPVVRAAPATKPARPKVQRRLAGCVPVTVRRPPGPRAAGEVARMLKRFEVKCVPFDWRMKALDATAGREVYTLEFPTPIPSPVKRNNTVHCEYFPAAGAGRVPGVIVLHILDGRFRVARGVSQALRGAGISTLLVKMPYYGPRCPADPAVLKKLGNDPETAIGVVVQAVADIRRAARWLATCDEVDPDRVGLCGVSLGGFAAALTGGVDGGFGRVAIVLAGGRLDKVITGPAREVRALREEIQRRKWTPAKLKRILEPIEPMTYASRLKSSRVLMIAAKRDKIVPPICAESLARASGAKITWYPASHYTMVAFLPAALVQLVMHFQGSD